MEEQFYNWNPIIVRSIKKFKPTAALYLMVCNEHGNFSPVFTVEEDLLCNVVWTDQPFNWSLFEYLVIETK